MTDHHFTIDEKLTELEKLIEFGRFTRGGPGTEAHRTFKILTAIASDLQARRNGRPSIALTEIGRRVIAAKRSKIPEYGYEGEHLMKLAYEVINRWNVLEQALQMFGAAIEEKEITG